MQSLPNIEKSAFRRFEYVGYGGGLVWRVRKHGCGGWEAFIHGNTTAAPYIRAETLARVSKALASMTAQQPNIAETISPEFLKQCCPMAD